MDTKEHWIGLIKQSVTPTWIWEDSQKEANFTPWVYEGQPCVVIKTRLNGWASLTCANKAPQTACEMYVYINYIAFDVVIKMQKDSLLQIRGLAIFTDSLSKDASSSSQKNHLPFFITIFKCYPMGESKVCYVINQNITSFLLLYV